MGNSPKDDKLTAPEWIPVKGTPYEQLRLERVSGNVSEFETPFGLRYRCVKENGVKQWFSFRTDQIMKRATRARVKVCCKKFERSFGIFVDVRAPRLVSAFSPKAMASAPNFRAKFTSARGVGRSWSFWKRGKSNHVFVPRRLDHYPI